MNKKLFIVGIVIASILAFIGIGFAAWGIVQQLTGSAEGTFTGYTIIDLDNITNYNTMEAFVYNEYGFYNEGYSYETSFEIQINAPLKEEAYDLSITLIDEDDFLSTATIESTATRNNESGTKTIDIENINAATTFNVIYAIKSNSSNYSTICSNLSSKTVSIKITATTASGTWTIDKSINLEANVRSLVQIVKPSADNTVYTYNGNEQTYNVAENSGYIVTGNNRTNAGTQTVSIALKPGYEWNDGTITNVEYLFTINQVVVGVKWTNTSLTYNKLQQNPTATATGIISGDTVNLSVSGGQTNSGSYTATVISLDNNNYALPDSGLSTSFTIAKVTPNVSFSFKKAYDGDTPTKKSASASYTFSGDSSATTVSGTYSFSTTPVTFGTHTSATKTQAINVTFTPTGSYATNYNSRTVSVNITIYAVCYINSTYYGNIPAAASAAVNSNTIYVIPGLTDDNGSQHRIDINENITIASGVTMCLPFSGTTYNNETYSSISNSDFIDSANDDNRKIYLFIDDNVTLTNNGTLNIGGTWGSSSASVLSHVSGPYSEIRLGTGSKIVSTGPINCYGYIKEENASIDDQLLGNGSIVECTNVVTTPFVVYDFVSAGTAKTLINNHVFPFAQFDIPNIQSTLQLNYGASLKLKIRVVVNGVSDEESINLVGNNSNYLISLTSGYLTIKYTSKYFNRTKSVLSPQSDAAITNINLNGNATLNYMQMSLSGIATIDTRTEIFPFTNRFILNIESGTFTQNYPVKFMNGSYLIVDRNATHQVNSKLLFYPSTFVDNRASKAYPSGLPEATLVCNGNLVISNQGYLGGKILTTNSDNVGKLNFNNVGQANLYCEVIDGSAGDITIYEAARGTIIDASNPDDIPSIENFVAGGTYESINQMWAGSKLVANKLTISLKNIGTSNILIKYSVYQADSSSGANQAALAIGKSAGDEFSIETGKYFKIVMEIGDSGRLLSSSHGYSGNVLDTWISSDGTYEIELTPVEKVQLTLGYSGTGVNHTGIAFTVYYSKTSSVGSNVYNDMSNVQNSGSGTYDFPKGYYFKVVYNSSWSSGKTATYTIPSGGVYSGDSSKHVNTNIYYACGNFTIKVSQDYNCLLEDTLITMADGSLREIQYLVPGDMVMVFNHETGMLDIAPVTFNEFEEEQWFNVIHLIFDNGTDIGVISEHGFFDLDTMKYEYIDEYNYQDFIGHRFYTMDGEGVTLVDAYVQEEYTSCYSLPTYYHLNLFTENILSMPGGITGLFNYFEYADNLQYDQEKMIEDINTYGLFTIEEFEPYGVTEEMFYAYAGQYLKVALGKGILTEGYLMYLVERYGKYTE